ncbi:MAG TPA: alkaline phosphatase family protein, partial [Rubrobacter sp.]|nr:alkaline phosphatase family protein [Rubrobacter sp.]
GIETPVYQSTSSPLRNPLGLPERLAMRFGWTERGRNVGEALSRLAGVEEPEVRWHLLHKAPWFHNHISRLEIRGRKALLKVERTIPENNDEPLLYPVLEYRLA